MADYPTGTPINLVERFWRIDPLTLDSTLTDPTVVEFQLVAPDGTVTSYVSAVDPEVTNASVGIWVCGLPAQTPGVYTWRSIGTGALEATSLDHVFTVYDSAADPTDETFRPGPCQPWVTGADVVGCSPDLGVGSDWWLLDDVAVDASWVLWELSGRQFNGICERTVRPCADRCGYWGSLAAGTRVSWMSGFYGGGWGGWGWYNDQGATNCGCQPLSKVRLAGYPVREILEVKIDGVVLPEFDTGGDRQWRLDSRRFLIRMDTPNPSDPGQPLTNTWPGCQNLALDDSEQGTWSVRYSWGMEAPSLGRQAAAQLARQFWLACAGSTSCQLPSKATKVVREGITVDRLLIVADSLRAGATGLPLIDAFMAAANATKMRRRPAIYSPDLQRFAPKLGQ